MSDIRLYLFECGAFKFRNIPPGLKRARMKSRSCFLFSTKRNPVTFDQRVETHVIHVSGEYLEIVES